MGSVQAAKPVRVFWWQLSQPQSGLLCGFAFVLFAFQIGEARAADDIAAICDRAAATAASETNVPLAVLQAITLTETGKNISGRTRSWPWTVNMEGKGYWFDNQNDAKSFIYQEFKRGARSFDVGCFQINYKWHGQAFASIEEMLDPNVNALYAARLLAGLYRETGDWSKAAGAYHSRTPNLAKKYRVRFDRLLAGVRKATTPLTISATGAMAGSAGFDPVATRRNFYPFLKSGVGGKSAGSLVSLGYSPNAGPFFTLTKVAE